MIAESVGRYRILRQIGSGGMGEVYLAEDTALQRSVALKLLSKTDDKSKRRFVREAITASKLSHPNVAVVYEAGESEDGTAFISMQYVEGETLRDRLRRGEMPIDEVVRIAIEVADALHDAHGHRIIHRDIKPGNIMIDSRGHAKVVDFGIAKLLELDSLAAPGESTAVAETTAGQFLGTLQYVSPEQAGGGALDGRSDIFSLGVVLYEMLTGKNPFTAPTFLDTVRRVRELTPPPIERSDCPVELKRIVSRCLEKSPERRYQSARDVMLDLQQIGRPAEQKRSRAVFAAAVLAIVLVAAAVILLQWPRKAVMLTQQDTILLADFTNQTGDRVFDSTLREALAIQLGQSPFLSLFPESGIRETLKYMGRPPDERLTPSIAREICQRQGVKAFLSGSIVPLGTRFVLTLQALTGQSGDVLVREQIEAARKEDVLKALGRAALSIRQKLGESLNSIQRFDAPVEQATTSSLDALHLFSLGNQQVYAGKARESIPFYQRAAEIDPQFALAYARMSGAYSSAQESDLAAEASAKAYELREHASEGEKFEIQDKYLLSVVGDLERRVQTLELWKQTYPRDWRPLMALAATENQLGNYERALTEARGVLRLDSRRANAHYQLAIALAGLNRGAEARRAVQQAWANHYDLHLLHWEDYLLASADDDSREMRKQREWAMKSPTGDYVLIAEMYRQLAHGQLRSAFSNSRQAFDIGRRRGEHEVPAWGLADYYLWSGVLLGRCPPSMPREILGISTAPEPSWRTGVGLAFCGHSDQALSVANKLVQKRPKGTLINAIYAPVIRASVELQRGNPAGAIELLRPAARYDLAFYPGGVPVCIRGLAYLRQRRGQEALAEFEKILNHGKYLSFGQPTFTLALLGAARASAMTGDLSRSRQYYNDLMVRWRDADPDVALVQAARKEMAELARKP